MRFISRLIKKLPVPQGKKLAWQRARIEKAYRLEIAEAKKEKNHKKAETLQRDYFYEIDMHEEDEDAYFTNKLLEQARYLKVPIPHVRNEDNTESDYWYTAHYSGRGYLTAKGIALLREGIRGEQKARREMWVVIIPALTGIIGAITGLVAVLNHK